MHLLAAEYERQGYSRLEAKRMAKREFGGSDQVKEKCRDESRWAWLIGLRQDLSFGLRIMRKAPMVTVAAILSLALGIGANTAIVSLMDAVLWRELPVPEPKQLVLINWWAPEYPREVVGSGRGSARGVDGGLLADFFSYPAFEALRTGMAGRGSVTAFALPQSASIRYDGHPDVAQVRTVAGNFFTTLRTRSRYGRLLYDSDDAVGGVVPAVVSHLFWEKTLGGRQTAIGRSIAINGQSCVIAGVLEPGFFGLLPSDNTEIYVPLKSGARILDPGNPLIDGRSWRVSLLARLLPGAEAAQMQPVMQSLFMSSWSGRMRDPAMEPRIRLEDGSSGLGSLRREFRNPLFVLGGLVGLLLVIACMNIAGLLLARALARQKEVAMRISLGCSRMRLMRQFLTESALLALAGGAASIVVAYITANVLGELVAERGARPVAVALDIRLLAVVGAMTAAALLLFGLFPAWRGSRLTDASWLKEGAGSMGQTSRHKWNAARVLPLVQVAMSVVLVMTGIVFTRNLVSIESTDPGFDRRNLVMFDVRPGKSGYSEEKLPVFYLNLERVLAEAPGVSQVGLVNFKPMNIGGWWMHAGLAGKQELYPSSVNGVTPAYLSLYSPRIIAGRNISRLDIANRSKVAVISEDLAHKLGGPGVVGGKLVFKDGPARKFFDEREIVGIAPTIAVTSMKEQPYAVWVPFDATSNATIMLRTSRPPRLVLPAIREAMAAIDSDLPLIDVITMEEQISKILQRERMFATLCSAVGILALVLTVIGLYGVMSYGASRRRSEIGVRLALGAVPLDVLTMVLREGLLIAVIGMAIGVLLVWVGAKYVEKELYQMKALEPLSFALTLGLLLVAALVAVGIPAFRASRLQPVQTLRQE
ncbi:MAG: ABC transporter permease [Bryobacterales bacterium]|nr:ABC transporter permease [Bryobacterales bacterium]